MNKYALLSDIKYLLTSFPISPLDDHDITSPSELFSSDERHTCV